MPSWGQVGAKENLWTNSVRGGTHEWGARVLKSHVLAEDRLRATLARLRPRSVRHQDELRYAAVATVIRYRGSKDPEVLLIRRSEHPDDPWSGHMAFPGGRREPTDPSLHHTAVRETAEEVGVDLGREAEPLGRLHDVEAIAKAKRIGLIIAPYVFLLRGEVTFEVDRSEVAEALWAPLRPMAEGALDAPFPYVYEGRELSLPSYRLDEHRIVWGLTHRMLAMLFDELRSPLDRQDVVPTGT